jgi:hypothetical protein
MGCCNLNVCGIWNTCLLLSLLLLLLLLFIPLFSFHRFFPVLFLLNQLWTSPLRLQVSDCSTFLIMCDVPSTAVFVGNLLKTFLVLSPNIFNNNNKIIINIIIITISVVGSLRMRLWKCELDLIDVGYGPLMSSCDHGNEHPCTIKSYIFLDHVALSTPQDQLCSM